MNGKLLTTAILTSLLVGGNAMASVARMAVLGAAPVITTAGSSSVTSNVAQGSLWYDDEYNVFYNPSYINDNKNYVTVEKSVEGGFFKSEFENFAYGVYLNRSASTAAGVQTPGVTGKAIFMGTTVLSTQRPIDLFLGGDTGVKWGLHLAWAYNRDQTVATALNTGDEISVRYWHADFGAQVMGLEPFVGTTFSSGYQANVTGLSANQGQQNLFEFNVGTKYKYEGWTPYVAYKIYRENGVPVGGALEAQTSLKLLQFGVGHDTKVADGVHIQKHIGFLYATGADDTAGSTTSDQGRAFTQYVLPLNVNLEAEATSWLTLRAGAAYDFWNETKQARLTPGPNASATDRKKSNAGTTTFRVGSTLKFGKLHVDSAFGNGTAAVANLDTTNVGFDSQLFALLSASYHW